MHMLVSNAKLIIPFIVLIAWLIGELGHQLTKIPRICFYTLVGFLTITYAPDIKYNANNINLNFIINTAIGLLIFEFGSRISFHWLKNNPKIIITSLIESICTFIGVFYVAKLLIPASTIICLIFAAVSIASSPIVVTYLVNQNKSSGQLTERLIHLSAINTIIAILLFKCILGASILHNTGKTFDTIYSSILMLGLSILLGIICAFIFSLIMNRVSIRTYDFSVPFAIFVIFLVSVATILNLSPLLACLCFGLLLRHRRVAMGKFQNHFGTLGELLTIILFVLVSTTLQFDNNTVSLWLSLILIATRTLIKTLVVGVLSRLDGLSWQKSFLLGLALAPVSMFSILTLDPTIYNQVPIFVQLSYFSIIFLLFELIAPIITQFALNKSKESL